MAKRGRKAKTYKIDEYFSDEKLLQIAHGDKAAADNLRIYIESNLGKYAHSTKKIRELEKELKEVYKDPANGSAMMTAKANWDGNRRKFNNVHVVSERVTVDKDLNDKAKILDAALLSNGMYLTYQMIGNPYDSRGSSPWFTYVFITAMQAASIGLNLTPTVGD